MAWLLIAAACTSAPPPADGTLLASEPWPIRTPYEQQDELTRFRVPRDVYEAAQHDPSVVCERIVYASDGLRITGALCRPAHHDGAPLPVILFCRGGTGDFGSLADAELVTFHDWARRGYVVIASNNRGGGGSEGLDTWDDAVVDDAMNLLPLLRRMPDVDCTRLFVVGQSRGVMTACCALRRGLPARAAVLMAGVTDLKRWVADDPAFLDGDDEVFRAIGWPGLRTVWADFAHTAEAHYRALSPAFWADELRAPILILHAKDDGRVAVDNAYALDAALTAAGREHELHVYEHDGHGLPLNREDRDARIDAWCRRHDR